MGLVDLIATHHRPPKRHRPSETRSTTNVSLRGSSPGILDWPPRATVIGCPGPAACAAEATSGSQIAPTIARSASASRRARIMPIVLALPPAPGLSWVSAMITGRVDAPAILMASPTAADGPCSDTIHSDSRPTTSL